MIAHLSSANGGLQMCFPGPLCLLLGCTHASRGSLQLPPPGQLWRRPAKETFTFTATRCGYLWALPGIIKGHHKSWNIFQEDVQIIIKGYPGNHV